MPIVLNINRKRIYCSEKVLHLNGLGVLRLNENPPGHRSVRRPVTLMNQQVTSSSPGKVCYWGYTGLRDCSYAAGTGNYSGSADPHDGSDLLGIDLVSYRFLLFVYFNIEVLRN